MLKLLSLATAFALSAAVAGCGGSGFGTAYIDAKAVLDRTVETLKEFDAYLRRYDYKQIDSAMRDQFNKTIQHNLNKKPRIHSTKIVTKMQSDASILGYGDLNGDGQINEKEPKLFKIEIDTDNNRIIITSASGSSTGRRMSGSGFFAGVMIRDVRDRQARAGIKSGHFNSRRVAGAPAGRKIAAKRSRRKVASRRRGRAARSRARSGGLRAGK
jgi:hypothetical protein